jgi:hypothetical protein
MYLPFMTITIGGKTSLKLFDVSAGHKLFDVSAGHKLFSSPLT